MRHPLLLLALFPWLLMSPLWAAQSSDISQAIARLREAPTSQVRQEAVSTLRRAEYRGPQAFRALTFAMLADMSDQVRRDAAVALLDYEGYETVRQLESFFRGEPGDEARRAVCVALATAPAHIEDRDVTTLLTRILADDPAATVRLAAAEASAARGDPGALGGLQAAASQDTDPRVRTVAAAAFKRLSASPKLPASKLKKPEHADYDAVKGKDRCPAQDGWCECSMPPVMTRPRCVPREDCEHTFYNSYRPHGFSCTWNGEALE